MKIRILKDFTKGSMAFKIGEVVEVSVDDVAKSWCAEGLAQEVPDDTPTINPPPAKDAKKPSVKPVEKKTAQQVAADLAAAAASDEAVPATAADVQAAVDAAITKLAGELRRPELTITREPTEQPNGGFRDFGEFVQHVHLCKTGDGWTEKMSKWVTYLVKTAGHMESNIDSQGGFLCPPEFRATLLSVMWDEGQVAARCFRIPMASSMVRVPAIDERSRAQGSRFGGLAGTTVPEGQQFVLSNPKLAQVELKPNKKGCITYVSDELNADAALPAASILTTLMGRELAFILDHEVVRGTGAGEALGILNAPATVNSAARAVATHPAGKEVLYSDITDIWSRLHINSQRNAVWLCHQRLVSALMNMTVADQVGGHPAFMPWPQQLSGAPFGTLMGRPVVYVEQASAPGTRGDIILADLTQYLLAVNGQGVNAAVSPHLRFDFAQDAYRAYIRFDGQPWWLTAITLAQGSATVSPFIVAPTVA